MVSVGGFHPQFTPPPLPFPNPKRVSLNILNHSNARIQVMGYFAITSNTAQFGARAELTNVGGAGWSAAEARLACVGEALERCQAQPLPQDARVTASHADWPLADLAARLGAEVDAKPDSGADAGDAGSTSRL